MRWLKSGFVALIAVALTVMSVAALELPDKPTRRINDYAGFLDTGTRQALETELAQFEERTSNQIVLVTFPSLESESLEDFANRLFHKWNLGQEGRSNGVLLIVFKAEKKIRIEVGYGLEAVLTDALSSRIIRNEMAPQFQAGRPDLGIVAAVTAIEQATQGEYKGLEPAARKRRGNDFLQVWGPFLFIMLIAVVMPMLSTLRRGPVVVGPTGRRRSHGSDWWGMGGMGGMGGGWGGGGGGGGGWGGGGGGDGGGFSGGGGDSGGGGASGGW